MILFLSRETLELEGVMNLYEGVELSGTIELLSCDSNETKINEK